MIDLVEARVIAEQIAGNLLGRRIVAAELAERRKRSYRDAYLLRVTPEAFRERLEGATLSEAYAKYRHICLETDAGHGVDLWDIYGKVLYIAPGAKSPGHPPIVLVLDDGSRLIVLPGVFGQMRLRPNEALRTFRDGSDPDVLDATSEAFTVEALQRFLALEAFQGMIIKRVITKTDRPGIMSVMGVYSQEALYRAGIHPKRKAHSLTDAECVALHRAISDVIRDAMAVGGRASERNLFDQPGGFTATVSRETEGTPCPACGTAIAEIKLGGAGKYYFCPGCQVL